MSQALVDALLAEQPLLLYALTAEDGLTDLSGNGHDGSAHGGITVGGGTAIVVDDSSSTDFDGSNDYVDTGYALDGGVLVRNLLKDPSAEGSLLDGWYAPTGTATKTAAQAIRGTHSMELVAAGGFNVHGVDTHTPVVAGTHYSVLAAVRADTAGDYGISVRDGASNWSAYGSTVAMDADKWYWLRLEDFVPTTANDLQIGPWRSPNFAAGQKFWIDAMMLVEGTTIPFEYVDGDQPGCVWDGTAHASASRQIAKVNRVTNPSFESGLSDWGIDGGSGSDWDSYPTKTQVAAHAQSGDYACRITGTKDATTTARYFSFSCAATVTGGVEYTMRIFSYIVDAIGEGGYGTYAIINWIDSAGGYLSQVVGDRIGDPGEQVFTVTGTAPADAHTAQVIIFGGSVTPSDTMDMYVDCAQLIAESSPSDYFDGYTPDRDDAVVEWSGTANASPSIRYGAGPFVNGRATTIVGVARRDADADFDMLFGAAENSAYEATELYFDAGSANIAFRTNATYPIYVDSGISVGEIFTWAVVADEPNDSTRLYINGELVAVSPDAFRFGHDYTDGLHSYSSLRIGCGANGSHPFNGSIAHVAVFGRAVSAKALERITEIVLNGLTTADTTRILDDSTVEGLELLPPFLRQDPTIQGTLDALFRELVRIQGAADELIENYYPATADAFLGFWEGLFNLSSVGKTLEQRRESVLNFLEGLSATGYGYNWSQFVESVAGSDAVYAEDNVDGLRGLFWERYPAMVFGDSVTWTFPIGSPTSLVAEDDGLRLQGSQMSAVIDELIPDQFVDLKFKAGVPNSTQGIGAFIKRIDANNYLLIQASDALRLTRRIGGSSATVASDTLSLVPGETYWLRAQIIGNDIIGDVYENDPIQGGTPIASVSYTLTGSDATALGDGITGPQGFYFGTSPLTDWRLGGVRIGEAGYGTIPDYTIRITLPLDPASPAANELESLLRVITPANLDLEIFYDAGFILGLSELGQEAL